MTLATWTEKQLGEICNIYTGNSINEQVKQKKYSNLSSGYNYIATKDIDFSSKIDYENGVKIPLKEPGFKIAPKNSTLLCIEGGSAGRKIAFTSQDICFVNKLCAFVSDNNVLNGKFLFYFLQSPSFKRIFSDKVTGLIGGVSTSKLKSISIVYPSLSEQQQIVEKLDALFADIEKEKQIAQKNLQNAKELFESGIQKLCLNSCGDNVVKVGDILSLEYGKALERQQRSETGKYLVYGANGPIGRTDQYLCEGKTIIVGRKGSVGEIVVALENNWPVDVTYWVKFDSNLYDFDFLYYLLRGLKLQSMAKGVKPGLNRNDVYALKVHVPQSINEQRNIAQKLNKLHEQTQKLEQIYTQQIADLDELKQAILKKAFNGEL